MTIQHKKERYARREEVKEKLHDRVAELEKRVNNCIAEHQAEM